MYIRKAGEKQKSRKEREIDLRLVPFTLCFCSCRSRLQSGLFPLFRPAANDRSISIARSLKPMKEYHDRYLNVSVCYLLPIVCWRFLTKPLVTLKKDRNRLAMCFLHCDKHRERKKYKTMLL